MRIPRLYLVPLLLCGLISLRAQTSPESVVRTYHVQQNVSLSDIPTGAKTIKWWISIPNDDRYQEVLDFSVAAAPGSWRTVTEPDHGNRFMLVEVAAPTAKSLVTTVEFTLRRRSVFTEIDLAKVGGIPDSH